MTEVAKRLLSFISKHLRVLHIAVDKWIDENNFMKIFLNYFVEKALYLLNVLSLTSLSLASDSDMFLFLPQKFKILYVDNRLSSELGMQIYIQ